MEREPYLKRPTVMSCSPTRRLTFLAVTSLAAALMVFLLLDLGDEPKSNGTGSGASASPMPDPLPPSPSVLPPPDDNKELEDPTGRRPPMDLRTCADAGDGGAEARPYVSPSRQPLRPSPLGVVVCPAEG